MSSSKWALKRTVQCAKCPWKKGTDPHEIPDGYCVTKHLNLANTIAVPGKMDLGAPLKIMACHHSKDLDEGAEHCVGWLNHQLGIGNNIPLRLSMMNCSNAKDIKVVGEQHQTFEETLPKHYGTDKREITRTSRHH